MGKTRSPLQYRVFYQDCPFETTETYVLDTVAERRARELSLRWPGYVVVVRYPDNSVKKYQHGRQVKK